MADIFVSYASEDLGRVVPLVEALETEGFSVWWDRRIGMGSSFDREIERELTAASCILVLWSRASIDSDWVREEASEGLEREILVPARLEDCRLPLGFRRAQTADLSRWPNDPSAMNQLLGGIRATLSSVVAGEVLSEKPGLQTLGPDAGTLATGVIPNSVAVLPFENLSPSADHAYFAAGVHDEILNQLSKIKDLRVIARTSVLQYAGVARPISEIANELRVCTIMEGSVRYAGDRVRVSAQLNDGTTGTHLWQETYDGSLADIFEIQSSIAKQIADALHLHLRPEERALLDKHPTTNTRAFECYMKARYESGKFTAEGSGRSITLLKNGLSFDPESELLNTALGYAYFNYGAAALGADAHASCLNEAERCARRVISINPESADGNALLGAVVFDRFQTLEGLRLMKQGVDAPGRSLETLIWPAFCFAMCGQINIAKAWVDELAQVDPFHGFSQWTVGFWHLMEGDFEAAETFVRRAHELQPDAPTFRTALGLFLVYLGRESDALTILKAGELEDPRREVWHVVGRILNCILQGERDGALNLLCDEDLQGDAKTDMVYAWLLADCYALLGDTEAALEWLERAVDGGFLNYPFLRHMDPLIAILETDEGFPPLMTKARDRWRSLGAFINRPATSSKQSNVQSDIRL